MLPYSVVVSTHMHLTLLSRVRGLLVPATPSCSIPKGALSTCILSKSRLSQMASVNSTSRESFAGALSHREPLSEAVKLFTTPINASIDDNEALESALWKVWHDLAAIVRQTDHSQQERVVQFVVDVEKEEGPLKSDGTKAILWNQEVNWKSLPLLGAEIRETWNQAPKDSEEEDDGWVNLNAFIARLASSSSPGDGRDFSLYAIWAFRDALEDIDLNKNLPNASMLEAASVWMLYAASNLKGRALNHQEFEGKRAREGQDLPGKEWTGFSMDRWKIWCTRLDQAYDKCEDGRTKELLASAISGAKQE